MPEKRRLLIVDDQLDQPRTSGEETRRQLYGNLSTFFDLHFLDAPSALPAVMEHGGIDAALVDFVLEEWATDVSTILRGIDGRVPVSLISNFWTPNFDSLRRVMEDYRISRLFTWDEMISAEGRDLVSFWIDMAVRHRNKIAPKSLDDDESFRVIHISDLQFGGDLSSSLAIDTELAIQEIQTRWSGAPHVVAITGDIAELGRPSEFEKAQSWLEDVRSKLGGVTSVVDLVTIPGNHDISRPLALAARIDPAERILNSSLVLFPDLSSYSLAPYRHFSGLVEPQERWATGNQYWVSGRYRYDGVLLFGLNTCESMDEWGKETRELSDRTVAALFAELRAEKRACPDAIVIGLIHHPLYGVSDAVTNPDLFRKNLTDDLGTVLLLAGHIHTDDTDPLTNVKSSFIQIMASTFTLGSTKRGQDTSRGFNLIELKRAAGVVTEVQISSLIFERYGVRQREANIFSRGADGKLTKKGPD